MKKTFKRAGVAVLSMAMLLSMGAVGVVTANAADYTVNETTTLTASNSTFSVYKISDNSGVMDGKWTLPTGKTIASYVGGAFDNADAKELAGKLASQTGSHTAVSSGITLGTFVSLADGYYLVIVDTTATNDLIEPMLVQVKDGAVTNSTPKTQILTLTKGITQVNGSDANVGNVATNQPNVMDSTAVVKAGDTVDYEIITSLPKYNPALETISYPAFITDTPTNMNDVNSTVTVYYKGGDTAAANWTAMAASNYTLTEEGTVVSGTDKAGFKILFTSDGMKAYRGADIKVTYSSTVLDTVDTTTTGNPNTAALTYSRNYTTGGVTDPTNPTPDTETVEDEATVYSAKLQIHKTDGTNNLDEVKFTLTKEAKYYHEDGSASTDEYKLTTNPDGMITIASLEPGTYTLTETDGKSGHRDLAASVTVEIGANKTGDIYNGTYEFTVTPNAADATYVNNSATANVIEIQNPELHSLPGTGGIGTTLFTVGGAAVVLFAGFLFVLYMRKRRDEE